MEAQTETQTPAGSLAATTIYDAVKIAIYQHYCVALGAYMKCRERQVKEADNRVEPSFIAAVAALYIDCEPKLDSYMNKKEVTGLAVLLKGSEADLTFKDVEKQFLVLRTFLERNGITKYEYKRATPEEYTLGGMIRK